MNTARPTTSIIICVYTLERWADICEAVESARLQEPAPTEIILVCDHNPQLKDYIARDIDLKTTLAKFKQGARELDPAQSGLYLRYHLMVAYAIDKKGIPVSTLLRHPPEREALEQELHALTDWP
jgi:hypothetical protein